MSEPTITTVAGDTLTIKEIINVIPYRDGLLMALTVDSSGAAVEHKVNASEYYYLKGLQ